MAIDDMQGANKLAGESKAFIICDDCIIGIGKGNEEWNCSALQGGFIK